MATETVRGLTRTVGELGGRERELDRLSETLQGWLRAGTERLGGPGRTGKDFLHGTWLGHPLHPVLTDVPVGAWVLGALMDAMGARKAADLAITAGVVAAVPTALTGAADWSEIEGRPRRVGLMHAVLNTAALTCYVGSIAARAAGRRGAGIGLSTLGLSIASLSAYLGGEMVYLMGTGVSRNAFDHPVEEFQVAARLADLTEGQLAAGEVTVDGNSMPLVLLRKGGEVLALSGVCSHYGGPLAEGRLLEDDSVECPWHGSRFSMWDGTVRRGPATYGQPRFETRIVQGNVEVRRYR